MGKLLLGTFLVVGVFILGLVFIAIWIFRPSGVPGADNSAATQDSLQVISVSAPKLWTDYHANEVAADEQYRGRRLIVRGQVTSISKGIVDDVYVLLSTFNEFEAVHADLKPEYQSEAARLRIGQIITVKCVGGGMVVGEPFLKECSIEPNVPTAESQSQPEPNSPLEPQPQAAPRTIRETNAERNEPRDQNSTGNTVVLPRVIYSAPAEYTAEARQNKLQGTVQIVLLVDENGDPQNVTVARSLGMGLDESAVEAVRRYRFSPAVDERTGKAVPAQISVNVQFHLY